MHRVVKYTYYVVGRYLYSSGEEERASIDVEVSSLFSLSPDSAPLLKEVQEMSWKVAGGEREAINEEGDPPRTKYYTIFVRSSLSSTAFVRLFPEKVYGI